MKENRIFLHSCKSVGFFEAIRPYWIVFTVVCSRLGVHHARMHTRGVYTYAKEEILVAPRHRLLPGKCTSKAGKQPQLSEPHLAVRTL